ncbi:hypothetical protein [Burkholderia cenocepacia]|uniref:hypothetical protein n=1 Tax=Burkholderia cenocepacia TaxID=95486 RepID=UPI000F65E05A|nr:hypothetical protein [Burkholderia cenocepacia]
MTIDYPSHWADMSNYLVHFAKGKGATKGGLVKINKTGDQGYGTMLSILSGGTLKPGAPFGIGRKLAPDTERQMSVCFSEIPPGEWSRLSERRKSEFGIGFSKQFIATRGGGPIWYARKGSDQLMALQKLMKAGADDPENPIWRITSMIDAPGVYGFNSYEYEWEREWRHIGALSFECKDVAFLFIPEALHSQARAFFSHVYWENSGPAYFCPFIDAKWSRERVEEELLKGALEVPPAPPSYEERHEEWDDGNGVRGSVHTRRLLRIQK